MDKTLSLHTKSIFTGLILLISFILLFFFIKSILSILLLMYLAIILAEGLRPIVADFEKLGVPYSLSIFIVFLFLFILLVFIGWLFISPLIDQLESLVKELPEYTSKAQTFLTEDQFIRDNEIFSALKDQLGEISKTVAANALVIPKYIFNFFFNTIVIFFIGFFWLNGSRKFENFFLSWIPPKNHNLARETAGEISLNIGTYLRGVLVMMVAIGVISGLGLWLLGVPYAFLLGLIAGLTEAIPIIGPFIGAVPALVIAMFISPTTALFVGLFYLVLQQLEGNVLVPAIMNKILKIDPLVILISVLIGTSLMGVLGAFIAVPTVSIIYTLVSRLVFSKLYKSP